ncbi:MAG: chemotaxis protein CheA, partial [Desulfobacterales bacterium]|nr:chemotaxis protein CheA [Desulfobacterales bacterium]
DLAPFEQGITVLQDMYRFLSCEKPYVSDISQLLKALGISDTDIETSGADDEANPTGNAPGLVVNQEDVQILSDFVVESLENLETIEINLIDLEQNPGNKETINAIFRPFHTVKGVSGFLNLKDINRLSHATENLLDGARQGEFQIKDEVIDIILESVDTLKKMIRGVESSLSEGATVIESGMDIGLLIEKIKQIGQNARQENLPLGEILLRKGTLKSEDLERSLQKQKDIPGKRLGEILISEKITESKAVISALRDQKKGHRLLDLQVKVDTKKLDNLVDLTGELVIAQAMLKQNAQDFSARLGQRCDQNFNHLAQIVSSLQKIAMSMRMVPIKSMFQKMFRVVRDLARNSGKEVDLEMYGEDTEIDRNVVDELYEPMVHMIRNSVDHGIESPEERVRIGKNRKGKVVLRAYHKGGNIIIEIEDDGKGLNKNGILEKAISKNLIDRDAQLTESEIFDLILQPGFSTAQQVTEISGRGVGMDVVKRSIEKLHGRLDIQSEYGRGTNFVIRLPLTLAIIEGMLVRVGKERYVIPTMTIIESIKPKKEDYYTVKGQGEMIMARGKLLPLIRLNRICGVQADSDNPWDGLVVVIENKNDQRCLLLDELLGQEEIVIKSLGESLKKVKGLAGGAILGDGRVGLILDMAGLFEISENMK